MTCQGIVVLLLIRPGFSICSDLRGAIRQKKGLHSCEDLWNKSDFRCWLVWDCVFLMLSHWTWVLQNPGKLSVFGVVACCCGKTQNYRPFWTHKAFDVQMERHSFSFGVVKVWEGSINGSLEVAMVFFCLRCKVVELRIKNMEACHGCTDRPPGGWTRRSDASMYQRGWVDHLGMMTSWLPLGRLQFV